MPTALTEPTPCLQRCKLTDGKRTFETLATLASWADGGYHDELLDTKDLPAGEYAVACSSVCACVCVILTKALNRYSIQVPSYDCLHVWDVRIFEQMPGNSN